MRRSFSEKRRGEPQSPYSRQPPHWQEEEQAAPYPAEEREYVEKAPIWRGDELLQEILQREPRLGNVLAEYMEHPSDDGYALVRSIVHTFGSDICNALDNDEMLQEINRCSYGEMMKRRELEAAQERQLSSWEQSVEEIDAFAKAHNISEDHIVELLNTIYESAGKIAAAQIDTPLLELFYRSRMYADDLREAEERGRISGRNEQIELRKEREQSYNALPQFTSQRPVPATVQMRSNTPLTNLELGEYRAARRLK